MTLKKLSDAGLEIHHREPFSLGMKPKSSEDVIKITSAIDKHGLADEEREWHAIIAKLNATFYSDDVVDTNAMHKFLCELADLSIINKFYNVDGNALILDCPWSLFEYRLLFNTYEELEHFVDVTKVGTVMTLNKSKSFKS